MRTSSLIIALLMLSGAACGSDGKKDDKPGGDGDGDKADSGAGDGDTGDGDTGGDGDATCNPEGTPMSEDTMIWTSEDWDACSTACGEAPDYDVCAKEKCTPGADTFFTCLDDNLYACASAEVGPNNVAGPCRTQYVSFA